MARLCRRDDSTVIVVPHDDTGGTAQFGALFEARPLFQVDFDVVPRARDVPNDAREREAAQIAMTEPRELSGMRVDARRSNVALISMKNGAQLAGELRFELLFGTGRSHVPKLVRECSQRRIERLRVGASGPADR